MAAAAPRYSFVVRWQPFLLRPGLPAEGVEKPPADPHNPRVSGRLKQAGQEVGIDFTGKCDRYPNTLQAHALLEFAKEKDAAQQNQLAEVIFKGYFTDGLYPDTETLVTMAESVGLKGDEVRKVITDQDWLDEAHEAARTWRRKGISSVPCFLMNDQRTFAGAQGVDAFLRMFDIIAERFPLEGSTECADCAKI